MNICPRCQKSRPLDTQSPAWQCPFCSVAYTKARDSGQTKNIAPTTTPSALPFRVKAILVLAGLAYCIWLLSPRSNGSGPTPLQAASSIDRPASRQQIAKLATSTPAEAVVIYTAPWCPACRSAKHWLEENKFRFQECDVEASSHCGTQMRKLGGTGIPFVVVREHPLGRGGFSPEAFVKALTRG